MYACTSATASSSWSRTTAAGFPTDVQESGLKNIRDRAVQLGGRCVVESSAEGTTLTWSVPFSRT